MGGVANDRASDADSAFLLPYSHAQLLNEPCEPCVRRADLALLGMSLGQCERNVQAVPTKAVEQRQSLAHSLLAPSQRNTPYGPAFSRTHSRTAARLRLRRRCNRAASALNGLRRYGRSVTPMSQSMICRSRSRAGTPGSATPHREFAQRVAGTLGRLASKAPRNATTPSVESCAAIDENPFVSALLGRGFGYRIRHGATSNRRSAPD